MKFARILFQIALLLVAPVLFSQSSLAELTAPLPTAPFAPTAPVINSHPAHHSVSAIIARAETGFMCDVVPLIALTLLGRAIWMLIPLQHRAAWSNHPAIQSVITNARAFPTRLRELAWSKWVWLMSPRAEPQDVDNGPRVEVPPLRSVPERITIF